jgi:hypothetical protein
VRCSDKTPYLQALHKRRCGARRPTQFRPGALVLRQFSLKWLRQAWERGKSPTHQRSSELTQVESASGLGLGHDCPHDFWIADVQPAGQLEGVGDDLERSISIERSWLATEIVQSLCASLFEQILSLEYGIGGTLCGQRLLSDAVKEIVAFAPARTIRGDFRQIR